MSNPATPAGYLTPGVMPVGAGPEQAAARAMRAHRPADAGFTDAVADSINDGTVVGFNPATNTWTGPQDNLIDFPPTSASNYLALEYAAPGSADIPAQPGRPVRYHPPAGVLDGSAPAGGA